MESRRRIVAFNRVTADGYFAAPDGNLDWVVPDDALDKAAAEQTSAAQEGTMLFGRRTYEMFENFWPRALDDPGGAPDPHARGRRSPELRALAVWINDAAKYVFSRTRKSVTWKNSRLFHAFDPRQIADLKNQPGGDIMLFGSGSIASLLTGHGLIDEYRFVVCPVLLGGGRSLVTGLSQIVKLTFREATPYPSGNVLLRYERVS
jgi:dihydrofolate reductase